MFVNGTAMPGKPIPLVQQMNGGIEIVGFAGTPRWRRLMHLESNPDLGPVIPTALDQAM